MNRRKFIRSTALITGAAFLAKLQQPLWAMNQIDDNPYLDTIGLQLWTVRNQLADDKIKTLQSIKDVGYQQVELMNSDDMTEMVKIARGVGLEVTSGFINWEAFVNPTKPGTPTMQSIVDTAHENGLKHLVLGYIGAGHRETLDQFKRHAENANKIGELCNAAGIKFSYHNHSFDFKPITAADGKSETTGFQTFIDEFQPELCHFEIDVFWVKVGGWDVLETLKKLDGRVTQIHLKDLKAGVPVIYDDGKVPHDAFLELGNGTIDMAAVIKVASQTGVEQCHVEQDQSPDPLASVAHSMQVFKTL